MARAKADPTAWRRSPQGHAAYDIVKAEARALANGDGYDRGIEGNDLFRTWRHFMLPQKKHRSGYELRCEVVSCDTIDRQQPGHGHR